MGFLEVGQPPLEWKDVKEIRARVKEDGLKQLMNVWRLNMKREDTDLKWGDEVEFCLLKCEHEKKEVVLSYQCDAGSVTSVTFTCTT